MPDKFRNKRKAERQAKGAHKHPDEHVEGGMGGEFPERDHEARGGMGGEHPEGHPGSDH
jgi:hypothetical protein